MVIWLFQCEIVLRQIETTDFYTPFVIFKIAALFGAAGPRAAGESETGAMAALVGSSVCDKNKQPQPFRIKYSFTTPVL